MLPSLDEYSLAEYKLRLVLCSLLGHPIRDFLGVLRTIHIFDDKNGVEEWPPLRQYLHLRVRPSTPFSRLVYPS